MGLVYLVVFCSYGLGFWYGSKLIREDSDYGVSNVLIVSRSCEIPCLFVFLFYILCACDVEGLLFFSKILTLSAV